LHAKLRNGHAGASTGATRFLAECLRRLPDDARLFLRADEGFWGQGFLAELERKQITYAVGAPLIASVRGRISAIAAGDCQPSSYRAGGEVASFRWRPKSWKCERRFIVRRDPVEVGEQLSLEGREWHYWVLATNDQERSADELECWHRAKANLENRIKEAKLGLGLDNLPCHNFHANWAYLLCTLLALQPARLAETARPAPARERTSYAKRLRFRFIAVAGTVGRSRAPARPTPLGRLPAPHRLPRDAATHPRPRTRTHLNPRPPAQRKRSPTPRAQPPLLPPTKTSTTPPRSNTTARTFPTPPTPIEIDADQPHQPLTAGSG
jgi:hypothetical protein